MTRGWPCEGRVAREILRELPARLLDRVTKRLEFASWPFQPHGRIDTDRAGGSNRCNG